MLRDAVAPLRPPRSSAASQQGAAQHAPAQPCHDRLHAASDATGGGPGDPACWGASACQSQHLPDLHLRGGDSGSDGVVDLSQMDGDASAPSEDDPPPRSDLCASQPESLSQPLAERLAAALDRAKANGAAGPLTVPPCATTAGRGLAEPPPPPTAPRLAPPSAAAALAGAPAPQYSSPPCSAGGAVAACTRLPPLTPGAVFGDVYDVVFLLDAREVFARAAGQGRSEALAQHLARLRDMGLVVEERTLPAGDGLWIARCK